MQASVLTAMRRVAAAALLPLLLSCAAKAPVPPSLPVTAPHLSLVPYPAHLVGNPGQFVVSGATPVVFDASDSGASRAADYLIAALRQSRGLVLVPAATPVAQAIVFKRDPAIGGKEGYRLDVTPQGVTISAGEPGGFFYGAITLWQLMTQTEDQAQSIALPAVAIDDAPRFAWRGLLLDSARHFQSVDFIKTLIDGMSHEKLNVLQWHLTDDQGWRLEIKRYPRLTSVGAWRVPAGEAARHDIDPATGRPRLYGGFYTQDQVREVVAYAAARNITIVPEIEMPGHARAAIVAYPWLGSVAHPLREISSDWGVFPYLYNVDDRTFRFLEHVLTETMALFPGPYIHIGGDEAVKDQWKASPVIQARMRALGITNEDALQSWFIQRIEKFLNTHGRKLIGWDEILQGGVAQNATITSWRGIDGGIVAAILGHDAVLSPDPTLYLDNRQAEGPNEPSGRGRIETLGDVYAFDPMPASLNDDQRKHIIGVQANIWTEHIREEDNVGYAAFPRAAALAELGWSPAAMHDWPDFRQRMQGELARYAAMELPHSDHLLAIGDHAAPPPAEALLRDSHELDLCNREIQLSIEGPAPLHGKRPVYLTDVLNPCWIWHKAGLTGIAAIEVEAGQLPFNFQIGQDVKNVVLRPTATPDGELEVHLDTCDGTRITVIPMPHPGWDTPLSTVHAALTAQTGVHDLCFLFTRSKLDPYWALHTVRLVPGH